MRGVNIGRLAAALLALLAASAWAEDGDTYRDRFRNFVGLDSGKKRIAKETLVRSPDGGFSRQTPSGLQPHPCTQDWRAAEELFQGKQYARAAKLYKQLARRHEGTAVEEDCLFQEAECYFHDGYWPTAADTYHKLLKDFPTTRHLRPAVQRSYDIAADWLEDSRLRAQGQPGRYDWHNRSVNFSDRRRPLLDTPGRAVQVIEHLQTYDPLGPLTGSAVMMAGAQSFTAGDYVKAAGYYEQIVAERPKDEFAAKAALLAAQSYLRSYQGPGYDGSDLLKAEDLTQRTLRMPGVTEEQKQRLTEDLRKILLLKLSKLHPRPLILEVRDACVEFRSC